MTTFSSDYFAQLHSAAVELIKRNRAYVCHQTKADVLACREAAKARIANPDSVPTESIYRWGALSLPVIGERVDPEFPAPQTSAPTVADLCRKI
jgi:glutamyl/glutaminyl-tRNA synthetase